MNSIEAHIFAVATPVLAAASQVIVKWQINQVSQVSEGIIGKLYFLIEFLFRPWVMVAVVATFLSGLTWIMALTKLDLSYAYPYVAITFFLVPLLGIIVFGEVLSLGKIYGGFFILLGIGFIMLLD